MRAATMRRRVLVGLVAAASAVHFQDDHVLVHPLPSDTDPTFADLAVRIDFSSMKGPGQRLLSGISMGSRIARQTLETQFLQDVSAAVGVGTDRLYVLNITEGDVHFAWGWTTTIVTFRMLAGTPTVNAAVRDLTDQTQHSDSQLLSGEVTGAIDKHWGVVALDMDMSLRLQFSMEVVGEDLVHDAGEGEDVGRPGENQSGAAASPRRWFAGQGDFVSLLTIRVVAAASDATEPTESCPYITSARPADSSGPRAGRRPLRDERTPPPRPPDAQPGLDPMVRGGDRNPVGVRLPARMFLRRSAATPRPRRGQSAETSRGAAAAATWPFRRDAATRRGYSAEAGRAPQVLRVGGVLRSRRR